MTKELTLMICCHNHGRFLPRMLEDVFVQTLNPDLWKLLIIFDECNDDSDLIFIRAWDDLCAIQGKHIDWLERDLRVRPKKNGLSACKNYGINLVDTKYIAYLDADDGMLPERLEIQYNFLNNNQEYDACFTQSWDRDKHGRLFKNCFEIGQYRTHDDIISRIHVENVLCHGSAMISTQVLKNINGYRETPDVLGMEDWELWVRMINAGNMFYNIPERLYIWSMNTSTSR